MADDITTTSAARQHEFSWLAIETRARIAEGERALRAAETALQASRAAGAAQDRPAHAVEYLTAVLDVRRGLLARFEEASGRDRA